MEVKCDFRCKDALRDQCLKFCDAHASQVTIESARLLVPSSARTQFLASTGHPSLISINFRVASNLTMKARLSTKLFIRKLVLTFVCISMKMYLALLSHGSREWPIYLKLSILGRNESQITKKHWLWSIDQNFLLSGFNRAQFMKIMLDFLFMKG